MVAGAAAVAAAVAVAVVVAVVVVVVETVARLVQCFLHWNLADVLECKKNAKKMCKNLADVLSVHFFLFCSGAKPRSANVDCFSCKRKTSQYPTGPPNGPPTMQRNNVEKITSNSDSRAPRASASVGAQKPKAGNRRQPKEARYAATAVRIGEGSHVPTLNDPTVVRLSEDQSWSERTGGGGGEEEQQQARRDKHTDTHFLGLDDDDSHTLRQIPVE